MSVEAAATVARVTELRAMLGLGAPVAPVAPPAAGGAPSFAAELASASAPAAPVAPGPVAPAPGAVAPSAPSAPAGPSALPPDTPFGAEITAAAQEHGIDPALLAGLVEQESGFDPKATSPAGAQGLTQLMPATAAGLGVTNSLDPAQALDGGAKYLREQLDRFGGDVARALAAYNAGPGAVEQYGGVPPYAETQHYVRIVQANAAEYRAAAPKPSIL